MSEETFGNILLSVLGASIAIVVLRTAYGKRHWMAFNAAKFLLGVVATLAIMFVLTQLGVRGWWVQYVAIGVGGSVSALWTWNRSRHIPRATRRTVIANWEARTGLQFDSALYDIDHKVPFSKGGWHTLDNLHVVRRSANRRKGGADPMIPDWVGIWRRKDER